MEIKLLFLDENHIFSIIAEHFAKKYKVEDVLVFSAGILPQSPSESLKTTLEKFEISINDQVSILSYRATQFDLVVVTSPISVEQYSVLTGFPLVFHWDLSLPEQNNVGCWEPLIKQIDQQASYLFKNGLIKAILKQKYYFGNIIDNLQEGVIAHDMNRRIFLFNRGAEVITGASKHQILGRDCHDIFKPHVCSDKCIFSNPQMVTEVKRSAFPAVFTGIPGNRKELDITRYPLNDENGNAIGAFVVFSDTTRLHQLEMKLGEAESFSGIIGRDYKMQMIFQLIQDLAISDFPVVITGESGTGKELVAAAIHKESDRRDQLFVAVNCGALPEGTLESELFGHVKGAFTGAIKDKKGRFELADKGTLFLDEIGELSPRMQVKLLRVLQEGIIEPVGSESQKSIDVRILCATNRNLKEMVARGEFREDLYYRLAVVPIELPPLRERRNDIILLAHHFLAKTADKLKRSDMSFSEDTVSILMNYNWPGNIRQLQNVIQFAMIKCRSNSILPEHLPPEILSNTFIPTVSISNGKAGRKPKLTADIVESALIKAGGNKAKAARLLRVGRATLYNFLNSHSDVFSVAD